MTLEPVFALILVNYLQRKVEPNEVDYNLPKYLRLGIYFSIALVIVDVVFNSMFISFGVKFCVFAFMWLVYSRPELRAGKPLVYAILPYAILTFIGELIDLGFPNFYRENDDFFESAQLFGLIWFGAMWLISHNQGKALEKERARRRAEEAQNRIMAELKVNLETEVAERTAELVKQKEELQLALDELKSTQAQLIQSEKMASLGELTAGIAHEIQNPLNFVNNFSEVSIELLNELKEGPLKDIPQEVQEEVDDIMDDLTQNLEKITLHGKRADGIVKSMLQHSRSSTGKKEETDINALADEYLRLSYHGLRAKDKSFNATMDTDLDPNLHRIAVVPQDLGRVLLNLFNNAFYAVNEKKKLKGIDYSPKIAVTTQNTTALNGKRAIMIKVQDNGLGIPQALVDKIYQPFFTTKPTGQGTGLGLSMSYDIITKVHGGTLKVDTKEGEYTTFTITIPE